jgi:hypothetical protein
MRDTGLAKLRAVPGVLTVSLGRGVENPSKFLLLIDWATMEAHGAYNKMPVCAEIRALIGRFSQGGSMEHFNMG